MYSVFARKGFAYWLVAAGLSLIAIAVGRYIEAQHLFLRPRYWIFACLEDLQRHPRPASRTFLVKITDAEFYDDGDGPLPFAGRRPLRRDVLAKLIGAVALGDPAVIAVDVDLRSPRPSSQAHEFDAYRREDEALWKTICAITARGNTSVVLTKALWSDETGVIADDNVYDGQSACSFPKARVSYGYAAVPFDARKIPPPLRLANGDTVDSLPVAVVRAYLAREPTPQPTDLPDSAASSARGYLANLNLDSAYSGELPFGYFVDTSQMEGLPAAEALRCAQDKTCFKLAHNIVVIFGEWHTLAADRGELVDAHLTPVGTISGGYLLANWVEAILSGDVRSSLPEWLRLAPDVAFVVFLYYALLVQRSLTWKISFLALALLGFLAMVWLLFQTAALFFDVFPFAVAIAFHLLCERLYGKEHGRIIRPLRQAKEVH